MGNFASNVPLLRKAGAFAVLVCGLAIGACGGGGPSISTNAGGAGGVAPSITTQPQNQTVKAGATATFSVVATGTAPLAYQWSKNGTAIAGATGASYITPATALTDSGESFTVVVSNSVGSKTSNAATLAVTTASGGVAPAITTQPQNQTVKVGANATFTVVATGTAPLAYQWSKNGTAIAGATGASYITPATALTDSGESFTVLVSNSVGSKTSNTAILTVTTGSGGVAPSITTQPQNQSVTSGATATFSVIATGTAPLAYQWLKNGTAIAGATGASYITPATALTDSGESFKVVVSNSVGSKTSNAATLTVAAGGTDVTTYHNDNGRTGQNLAESNLTAGNVNQATFGLLHLLAVDGKIDAQPLVLSNYVIGGTSHNVVYVATEHDSVYAFDTDSGVQLWHASLVGSGETPSDARGCNQVVPEIGVTATPAVDRAAGSMFVVAMSKDSAGNYYHRLHALNLATGLELASSPVTIAASVTSTGAPDTVNGQIVFDPGQYKERSALLLTQGTIYTSWASHCDGPNYTGWILTYNESTLQQTAIFNDEPSGVQGGGQGEGAFWNANSGPSADAVGNIYAMSANGIFDLTLTVTGFPSGNDYGNSIIKLSAPTANTLSVLDYFTMFNTAPESAGDIDFGSGGLMLLPDQLDSSGNTRHLAIGAGKDQNLYFVDRDNLGKFNSTNDNNAYQPLLNAFPNNSAVNCTNLDGSSGVYGAPVYYNGTVYYAAAGDVIRAYRLVSARLPSQANVTTAVPFCYPGATLAISANGSTDGILWAVGNSVTQGVMHAYDATSLSELYNSTQAGTRDQFGPGSKFTPPTVANGKVFVGTQADTSAGGQNYVAVFGLL